MFCILRDTWSKDMLALQAVAISVGQPNNVHSGLSSLAMADDYGLAILDCDQTCAGNHPSRSLHAGPG